MLEKLTPESEKWALAKCICPGCPTYRDCRKDGLNAEYAFCIDSVGKSKCIKIEKGCICMACPVHRKLAYKHMYFCTKGSETQQLGAK